MANESRESLIEKLLTTSHLNAVERKIFLSTPISFDEFLSAARRHFASSSFIPSTIESWQDDRPSYDGFCLEYKEETFILHYQVLGARMDVHHSNSLSFNNLEIALQLYLQLEFSYEIDGVTIGRPVDR